MFCLPQQFVDQVKTAFKKRELNPDNLSKMTSVERRAKLAKLVGEENAQQTNLLFEQKSLLKNQEKAMYDWAKQITGMSQEQKAQTIEKIRQTFADKTRRLYDPKENEVFLNEITSDVYSRKYKTEISLDEAQTITELAQEAKVAKDKAVDFKWENPQDGLDYGAKKVALDKYIGDLKLQANERPLINPLTQKGIANKLGATLEDAKIATKFIAENSRAVVASLDNSFFGRQGLKALLNPKYTKQWINSWLKSWNDIAKTIKGGNKAGDAVIDAVKAEIYSRENYLNGKYEMGSKLDIGTGEEAFPTSAPSKIPVLGRLFKASEVAYEAGAMRLRADIADKVYQLAEKSGVDMTNKVEVGAINQMVNSMTGRGKLRVGEDLQKMVNNAFFSVKFLKSNIDFLTDWVNPSKTSFVRQQSATNLLNVIASIAIIGLLAKALNPDDNKDFFNPTSTNLGKIKNGNMTIDVTGGMSGLVVLAGKILKQKSTSGTTGITTKLGESYGSQTGMDVFWSFTENKFSPMFSILRDLAKQETFEGKKPTIQSEVGGLLTPILIGNLIQNKKESASTQIVSLITDALGFNTNVYSASTDWGESTSKELAQFKTKVGDTKFQEANDLFNQQFNDWFKRVKLNPKYIELTDEQKKVAITNKKAEIKKKIFIKYGFKYKQVKSKPLPKL